MKKIVFDADNTMGAGSDVDDGLALLYLLGHSQDVELLGLTCSYGNSDMDTVYANTQRLARELGLNVPVLRGGSSPADPGSEAARFLAQAAAEAPGEVGVLATGSLTNLRGAAQEDPAFFGNLREVALMGGLEHTLVVNGRIMNELNFSCDPQAIEMTLAAPCPVTVATSQACLPALFTRELFTEQLGKDSWLMRECGSWFRWWTEHYGLDAFVCWDIVAAAALVQPELFEFREQPVTLNPRLLQLGYLEKAAPSTPATLTGSIRIPVIKDAEAFRSACFSAWQEALGSSSYSIRN